MILESFGDFKTAVNERFGKDRMEREFLGRTEDEYENYQIK